MRAPAALEARWQRCWESLSLPAPVPVLAQLLAAWSEPHRHYHTLEHLEECLQWLDRFLGPSREPRVAEIELALWFHDAIYLTRRDDNEQRSADWAQAVLGSAGAPPPLGERIAALVLATRHQARPDTFEAQWLVDIDLVILAAEPPRFAQYEAAIRREYDWVEAGIFRRERARVVAGFMQRPRIYSTEIAFAEFEQRARHNLQRSLDALTG